MDRSAPRRTSILSIAIVLTVAFGPVEAVAQRVEVTSRFEPLVTTPAVLPLPAPVRARPASGERSTARGVKIGAIAGAAVGAVGGAFLGLVVRALCESDCHPRSATLFAAETGLLGAVLGAGSGAILGAIVGAAVPAQAGEPAEAEREPASERGIGRLMFVPAVSIPATTAGGAGPGGSAGFAALLGRASIGLEGGVYRLGGRVITRYPPCLPPGPCVDSLSVSDYAWSAGAVVRLEPLGGDRLRPYALLGAGLYSWRTREEAEVSTSLELVGYSWGLGVQAALPKSGLGLAAEARRHDNLSVGAQDRELGFYTLGLGLTYSW